MEELTLQPGQTVVVPITKHLSYRVTHDGWGLMIECSRAPMVIRSSAINGAVSLYGDINIGSEGPVEDDEV